MKVGLHAREPMHRTASNAQISTVCSREYLRYFTLQKNPPKILFFEGVFIIFVTLTKIVLKLFDFFDNYAAVAQINKCR